MIKNGGDFSKLSESIPKKQIKCFVKESFPHFLVTDNFFYVACYFTKKVVDDFKAKYPNVNITDLKSKVIIITDWTLEMSHVNSADVFTSYGGIEIKLIVKQFKPSLTEKDKVTLTRYPVNLFRDDEMKTLIQNYTHGCVTSAVNKSLKHDSMPEISKFSSKGKVNDGIVAFSTGNFNPFGFKEGKTSTVDMTTIFKQEKGADALRKLQAPAGGSSKAKVVGGAKAKKQIKKGAKGADVRRMVDRISKFTPGQKGSVAKKSTSRIMSGKTPTLPSPGGDKDAGTTDHQSMKDFKKMVAWIQKSRGKGGLGKKTGGKLSAASKGKSGKKSTR